jgi:DNA-binding MarR family transcriptional regulator
MSFRDTIRLTHQALCALYERDLRDAEVDLTAQQAAVLAAIAEAQKPSQSALVDATGIDRSTMTDIVGRLSRKSLISRRRDTRDHRRNVVELTTKGKEINLRAGVLASSLESRILERIPAKGLETKLNAIIAASRDSAKSGVAAE